MSRRIDPNRLNIEIAIEYLQKALADGPRPINDLIAEAADLGIEKRLLGLAADRLSIQKSQKQPKGLKTCPTGKRQSYWSLPQLGGTKGLTPIEKFAEAVKLADTEGLLINPFIKHLVDKASAAIEAANIATHAEIENVARSTIYSSHKGLLAQYVKYTENTISQVAPAVRYGIQAELLKRAWPYSDKDGAIYIQTIEELKSEIRKEYESASRHKGLDAENR